MWQNYLQPTTLQDTLELLGQHMTSARIVAGGTDVVVELQRGIRPTTTLIDITRLDELCYIREVEGQIRLGGLTTHNDVIGSATCVARALPLAQACWEVGAPQIRTRGTLAGNLVTASPANDTITPLMVLDAELLLASVEGERIVPLRDFYVGFRRTVLRPDELIREIRFAALCDDQRGLFLKLGLRRAQAISVINIALLLTVGDSEQGSDEPQVQEARIALGCVAPTIVRAPSAESYLGGKRLNAAVCREAGRIACGDVAPIDDLRGSASYRQQTLASLITHGLERIAQGQQADGWPSAPVLLDTAARSQATPFRGTITTSINGQRYHLEDAAGKTLLDALREDAGLTGTKEGCAEGECGACTVWLDGAAVMACLVPAAQAHGATLTTIEGLAGQAASPEGALHPLQQAFIDHAAVQCGYCIPGMLMAGAKLLAERPQPTEEQVAVGLSGNICRCTGYRKIVDAVLGAAGAHEHG
ncbi:MAG: FAD binding domain-containing protein [Herpetosiphonaceae bacterium]|nr:FAD binding domain-containing protein [Herpetosiphonaceae bacterium]